MKFHLILDILLGYPKTFESLNQRYTDLSNDLTSARDNSQCACRRRVIEYLQDKYENFSEEKEFIDNLISENDFVSKNIKFIMEDHDRINNALGQVYKVEKVENYYAKFLDKLRDENLHHFIRALSVVDKGDYVEIYLVGWKF